jgi:hypothetical protein
MNTSTSQKDSVPSACSVHDVLLRLRELIRPEQRAILDRIWQEYRQSGKPLARTTLHVERGSAAAVRDMLAGVGGSVVFESPRAGDQPESYCLTLLGALLTSSGQRIEDALTSFLEHVRSAVRANPSARDFGPGELSPDPALAGDHVELLHRAFRLDSTRLSLGGRFNVSDWSAQVPDQLIDEILDAGDLRGLVRSIAVEHYDPRCPIGQRERLAYMARRARRQPSIPDGGDLAERTWFPQAMQPGWECLLHPVVAESSLAQYRDGHLREAVLNSVMAVFQLIKAKTNLDLDGDALATRVFSQSDRFSPSRISPRCLGRTTRSAS